MVDSETIADAPADADALTCPLCGYNLHGLPEPRCPECGYQFEWAALIEQRKRHASWFFEHAGTPRSFFKTRWRSLRPFRFWKEVQPAWAIQDSRLIVYIFVTLALAGVLFGITAYGVPPLYNEVLSLMDQYVPQAAGKPVTYMILQGGKYAPYTVTPRPVSWRSRYALPEIMIQREVGVTLVCTIGLAVLTPLFWLLLRGSAKRFHLRGVQFARVVAYTLDPLPLLALLPLVGGIMLVYGRINGYLMSRASDLFRVQLVCAEAVLLLLAVRIFAAARHYLRLPHAGWVAVVYVVIVTLTLACVILQLYPLA